MLSPEDLKRLDTLFERAADLPSSEHEAFLARECGSNDALREELAQLLAGLRGEDHLDRLQRGVLSRLGTQIGPYRLLEKIGEGGMGEVYAAEQRKPILRRVALKIIKPGLDSSQVIARFEAERQALARMSHPNIAQVFDGGTAESGSPYFVMEYVAGDPVTDYCDRRRLSTRRRLEVFLGICEGVQHAHQKGIIHRDLKPSNLLVMEQDGRATAKIIDFGIARATSGRLRESTLHTQLGQIVGTLDYMSPEQADPTSLDIDTRSDIYSLGVVLYQLLCGMLPLEHLRQLDLPLSEVQRAIRESIPPMPSTRLRRQRETTAAMAPLHDTDERSLVRQLSGDLDWICLKALEKDPARRYASAAELAEDLRRHLRNEPVLAGRPDALYRARKFVRRNRLAVTATALVSAGMFTGGFGIVAGKIERRAQQPQVDNDQARKLLRRADELWPPGADRIREMDEWIAEARDLVRRGAGYEEDLERLRAAALPRTAEQDRASWPLAGKLARVTACLTVARGAGNSEPTDETRPKLEQRIRDLEAEEAELKRSLAEWRTWRFESPVLQSRHDVLAQLADELRLLGDGLLSTEAIVPEYGWSMPKRREFSLRLEQRTVGGPEAKELWDEAIAAIAASPKYEGLQLEPQLGLIPIGEDPHSGLWEFAHLQSGSLPRCGPDGRVLRTGLGELLLEEGTGLVFALIPGGTFRMGVPRKVDEPQKDHAVSLSPYFLSKYEMTQGQWKRLTGTNPSDYGPDNRWEAKWLDSGAWPSLLHPVEQVSWWDCMKWLPRAGLMLPSEAQWECAAKAGKNRKFWWSDQFAGAEDKVNLLDEYAVECNYNGLRIQLGYELYDGSAVHNAVGTYEPNPFGLFNVHGNVFEWCLDGYDELTPSLMRSDDGLDPWVEWEGTGTRRHRGGSFRLGPAAAGSWDLQYDPPDLRGHALGVRPARAVSS